MALANIAASRRWETQDLHSKGSADSLGLSPHFKKIEVEFTFANRQRYEPHGVELDKVFAQMRRPIIPVDQDVTSGLSRPTLNRFLIEFFAIAFFSISFVSLILLVIELNSGQVAAALSWALLSLFSLMASLALGKVIYRLIPPK